MPGSSKHYTINITITDSNTVQAEQTPTGIAVIPPTTSNYSFQWECPHGTSYGAIILCADVSYGNWTFEVLKNNNALYPSPTETSGKFIHMDSMRAPTGWVTKKFMGIGYFSLGDNLGGECGVGGGGGLLLGFEKREQTSAN